MKLRETAPCGACLASLVGEEPWICSYCAPRLKLGTFVAVSKVSKELIEVVSRRGTVEPRSVVTEAVSMTISILTGLSISLFHISDYLSKALVHAVEVYLLPLVKMSLCISLDELKNHEGLCQLAEVAIFLCETLANTHALAPAFFAYSADSDDSLFGHLASLSNHSPSSIAIRVRKLLKSLPPRPVVQLMRHLSYETTVADLRLQVVPKFRHHCFLDQPESSLSKLGISRVIKEVREMVSSLPVSEESSIFVALISGPRGTPYENGLFEFHIKLTDAYPMQSPLCKFIRTGDRSERLHFDLNEKGDVALSLLGTKQGESWTATCSIVELLVSIQDKIFRTVKRFKGERNIRSHTIRYAIGAMLQFPPEGFEEVVKQHFKFKREEITYKTSAWKQPSTLLLSSPPERSVIALLLARESLLDTFKTVFDSHAVAHGDDERPHAKRTRAGSDNQTVSPP
jgi:ubiquitin-protein ligase